MTLSSYHSHLWQNKAFYRICSFTGIVQCVCSIFFVVKLYTVRKKFLFSNISSSLNNFRRTMIWTVKSVIPSSQCMMGFQVTLRRSKSVYLKKLHYTNRFIFICTGKIIPAWYKIYILELWWKICFHILAGSAFVSVCIVFCFG